MEEVNLNITVIEENEQNTIEDEFEDNRPHIKWETCQCRYDKVFDQYEYYCRYSLAGSGRSYMSKIYIDEYVDFNDLDERQRWAEILGFNFAKIIETEKTLDFEGIVPNFVGVLIQTKKITD